MVCSCIMYPIFSSLPGTPLYEDPADTMHMFFSSTPVQHVFLGYFLAVMFFNVFSVLVTDLLNSLWKTIINLIRPLVVWLVGLFTHYCIDPEVRSLRYRELGSGFRPELTPSPHHPSTTSPQTSPQFGEKWTKWSFLQLLGLIMLVSGISVYNGSGKEHHVCLHFTRLPATLCMWPPLPALY